jgi:hypothetical protein
MIVDLSNGVSSLKPELNRIANALEALLALFTQECLRDRQYLATLDESRDR